jgi:hypothetical protein
MMQSLLLREIEALDASELPPTDLLPLIDFLRSTAIPVQEVLEPRFLRKPLPMTPLDQKIFETSHQLWTRLGIAYLRIAPHFAPADRLHPLHRAASTFRLAELCYLQAAKECPVQLDRLLFATLAQAEQIGLQRQPVPDSDFRHLGDSNIAGHVAWAFLLRLIEPYALSVHQMAVASRALSRWRELAGFQAMPDSDPKAQAVPLSTRYLAVRFLRDCHAGSIFVPSTASCAIGWSHYKLASRPNRSNWARSCPVPPASVCYKKCAAA